jgi:hypothetical protein
MTRLGVSIAISLIVLLGFWGSGQTDGPLSHVTTVPLGAAAHDIALREDLAYVATDTGLTILDLSNPASPTVRSSIASNFGRNQGVAVKGQYAYLASRYSRFEVVDVSDPDAPRIVASRKVGGQPWGVAIKDDIAYVVSFTGTLNLFDISNPLAPRKIRTIGLIKWVAAESDAIFLPKLNNLDTGGSALVTGVSVTGNALVAVDWGLGRLYYYDVTDAANPRFRGTHYAPFLLKAEADPDRDVVYMLSAYGRFSGLYSVPISAMSPTHSTRYDQCSSCSFLRFDQTTQGGLAVSTGGRYVLSVGGGKGQFNVVDASDPASLKIVASAWAGKPQTRAAESLGVANRGNYIYLAVGAIGVQVYLFPGLSD